MAFPYDELTQKKLVLAKQLYQHAVVQSFADYSTVNRIMCVINLDLAVETVLRVVINTLDSTKKPQGGFPGLLDLAERLLTDADYDRPVPDRARILHVHSIRNDAQHRAKYPNKDDVSECRIYVRDFLRQITRQVWGVSFENISLTDLVDNPIAKQFLKNAEAALTQGNYEETVTKANAALSWAINQVPRVLIGDSFGSSWRRFDSERRMGRGAFSPLPEGPLVDRALWKGVIQMQRETSERLKEIYDTLKVMYKELDLAFEKVQDTLVFFTLGVNHADLLRFKKVAGNIRFYRDEDRELRFHVEGVKKDLDRNVAEFAFAYCTNMVIQIESQVGNIDAPFE